MSDTPRPRKTRAPAATTAEQVEGEPGATAATAEPAAARPRKPAKKRLRPIALDGERLSRRAVLEIALRGRRVMIAPSALRRVSRASSFLQGQLKRGEAIYGVTTGFGSNADQMLGDQALRPRGRGEPSLVEELQHKLILSHAVCVGAPLPAELVRAMMAIRINTLLRGHSGARVNTLRALVELLNRDILPLIPESGSVGASGDLAPLSHMALPLLGVGEVLHKGVRKSAAQALQDANLEPIELGIKEGLALSNGTTLMLAYAVLSLDRLEAACKSADLSAALSLEAFCGRSAAFDERVHALRPHPGQEATAANLRALLKDSQLIDIPYHRVPRFSPWTPEAWADEAQVARTFDIRWDYVLPAERAGSGGYYKRALPFRGGKKAQPQDAYSLRCIPQVHGAVKDSLAHLRRVVDIELNAVTDNPLVFAPSRASDDEGVVSADERVLSAGNFHGMPLALAMAAVKAAVPVLASISERRIAKLVDPATSDGLPPFLVGNEDGTDSGLMIVQYTAAALVNQLATRAHPACVYSVPTSANAEDHVSMGATDGRDLWQMSADLEQVLAIELLTASQALDYRLQLLDGAYTVAIRLGTQALRRKIRNISPARPEDAGTLAEDIKRLQADLKQLQSVRPGVAAQAIVKAIREAGVAFVERDRYLGEDLQRVHGLLLGRRLIGLVERELGIELNLD